MATDQMELGILSDMDRTKDSNTRVEQVARHRESMACCWSEWTLGEGDHGQHVEVHSVFAFNVTHQAERYHYCAPCRVLSIVDPETITVVIEYRPGSPCEHYNGEILRLDILDVWPPTARLWQDRHDMDQVEQANTTV